jgi:hypothetical protein
MTTGIGAIFLFNDEIRKLQAIPGKNKTINQSIDKSNRFNYRFQMN